MNYFDIIFAIPLVWITYKGFSKGLVIELASLIALLLGIYVSIHFSYYTQDILTGKLNIDSKYISMISFVVTFAIVIIVVFLLGKALEKVINLLQLKLINKLIGALFGFLKAAFILSVLIFLLNKIDEDQNIVSKETRDSSFLFNPISLIAPTVFPKLKMSELKKIIPSVKQDESQEENFE